MFVAPGTRNVSRKVSVDSIGDAGTDDLLRNLYSLAFRQESAWGWLTAICFLTVPLWISFVCWSEGNLVCATVFGAVGAAILGLRLYCLRLTGRQEMGPDGGSKAPAKLEAHAAE